MFRRVPLSMIRRFSLYTQQWYTGFADSLQAGSGRNVLIMLDALISQISRRNCPDPARKLSANLYDIYHCGVYSENLLMMDRGTVRNM